MSRVSRLVDRFPGEMFAVGIGLVVVAAIFVSPWAALGLCMVLAAGQAYLVGRAYAGKEAAATELAQVQERDAVLRAELNKIRSRLPYEDSETGVGTRKQLEVSWTKQVARNRRWGEAFSLAVLEFTDAFRPEKLLSPAGASSTANALLDVARTEDIVCRLDNHTFAVLLAGTGTDGARAFVDRLRIRVSAEPQREPDGADSYLTVVGGVAEWTEGMRSLVDLLAVADSDMALFRVEYGRERAGFEANVKKVG